MLIWQKRIHKNIIYNLFLEVVKSVFEIYFLAYIVRNILKVTSLMLKFNRTFASLFTSAWRLDMKQGNFLSSP